MSTVTRGEPLFVADSFGKTFGDRRVLVTATCWARPGRITVVLGRNDAGKTTLLRCALGLVGSDYGVVKWGGRAFRRPRLERLAREGLCFVPDRGLLSRRLTLASHLEALRSRYPHSHSIEAWDPLEVAGLADRHPRELSAGEKRRMELTLGFLRNPTCLIADEPFLGLAPLHQDRVAAALRALARRGSAVLVTGHEVDRLLSVADEVIWMVAGSTRGLGSPEAARAHRQFRREYLGTAR